jgi:hypothetical protein
MKNHGVGIHHGFLDADLFEGLRKYERKRQSSLGVLFLLGILVSS